MLELIAAFIAGVVFLIVIAMVFGSRSGSASGPARQDQIAQTSAPEKGPSIPIYDQGTLLVDTATETPYVATDDETFMEVARVVSRQAKCRRRQVGAVIVLDRKIVATGRNGSPPGAPECIDGACPRGRLSWAEVAPFTDYSTPGTPGYCVSTHAEVNAILNASGAVRGATMYVTCKPCPACRKLLLSAGIANVRYPSVDPESESDQSEELVADPE